MAKHNSKKQKKSLFYEEKSLVGLTPEVIFFTMLTSLLILFEGSPNKKHKPSKRFVNVKLTILEHLNLS
jgi:hypothetical protein